MAASPATSLEVLEVLELLLQIKATVEDVCERLQRVEDRMASPAPPPSSTASPASAVFHDPPSGAEDSPRAFASWVVQPENLSF